MIVMGVHTIRVIYDPTTRRISLAEGSDLYGGATTDVDSVSIEFTGIISEGTNFIARVDFAVPVKTDEHTIQHPFILLEQDNDKWTATIPNAVLAATKDTRKLPFQLILANDSQVINSRNAIVLETTAGIDSVIPGEDLPEYEMPEWPVPTGVSEDLDVHTVEVTYDPSTRTISVPINGNYGGATIDTRSVRINITGIEPIGADFGARIDYAVPIRTEDDIVIKPFSVLEQINNTWCAMVPQAVLMAAKETKKLPIQLVTRHGDTVINSRNTIVLEITRAINSAQSMVENYMPYIMYRNDTWEWIEDFTYGLGSVVTKNGEIYVSLTDDNLGHDPEGPDGAQYWELKGNGAPPGGEPWQILGMDPTHVADPIWITVSETHIVTTEANTVLEIAHQFGDRPVSCTFFMNGSKVEVPYACSDGMISVETTSARTLTVVITALPSEAII